MPAQSERFAIPGNAGLDAAGRAARTAAVYDPFRTALSATLDARPERPLLITLHSFTPIYHGKPRAVEFGVLHDADDRAARILLDLAGEMTPLNCAMNQPYSATDGVTHTLRSQGQSRGLSSVMLEIRNDLIDTPAGVHRIAALLAPVLARTIAAASALPALPDATAGGAA